MNLLAQVIGIAAILFFALSPQQKTKGRVLIFQSISSILYALQYVLLGAFSAVATNLIGLAKNLVFYRYAKENKDIPVIALGIYSGFIIVFGFLTYTNPISVIPVVLSLVYAYGIWQMNLKIYRGIAVVGAIVWIIYNLMVGAYVSVLGNAFQFASAVIAVWRLDIKKEKSEKFEGE